MKKSRRLYILAGCLIILTISGYSQKNPEHQVLKAVAFFELQIHDSVIFYLEEAKENMGRYPETHILYGRSLMAKGQYMLAIQEFLKAEKKDKGLAAYWIAKAYAGTGNLEETINYLNINLGSSYRIPESRILMDPDFMQYEHYSAWKEFWKTTGTRSSIDNILFEADYKLRSENYTEAIDIVNEGLKRGLRKTVLHTKRADIYIAMNNYRMAIRDLTDAIEGDRRNYKLYSTRASLFMITGKYKLALADYDLSIKHNPLNLHTYNARSEAHNKLGNYDMAVDDIEFYLTYFPSDHKAWHQSGNIHFSAQKYIRALESFNKALELNRKEPEYFASRGETYMQTKTYRYAWNDFSMALDLNPVNSKVYLSKGIAAVNLGNMKDACHSFEMARRQGAFEAEEFIRKYCEQR